MKLITDKYLSCYSFIGLLLSLQQQLSAKQTEFPQISTKEYTTTKHTERAFLFNMRSVPQERISKLFYSSKFL